MKKVLEKFSLRQEKDVAFLGSLAYAAAGDKYGREGTIDDEPEAAVLLVACAIGLATGGGVVLFNNVIHTIRHYAWQVMSPSSFSWFCTLVPMSHLPLDCQLTLGEHGVQETPVEATHWGRWARQLPFSSAVPVLVAPPVVGGIVVGSLRALTNFDDPTASKGKGQQGSAGNAVPQNGSVAAVPSQASTLIAKWWSKSSAQKYL